jgi:CBS domain-containing protein
MTAPLDTLVTWTPLPLDPSDTVEEALGRVLEDGVETLPVIGPDGILLGVVGEDVLLEASGPDAAVASVLRGAPIGIAPDAHVFEATKLMVQHNLTALPIIDEGRRYLGFARRRDIFERYARMLATGEAGAIVTVEMEPRDFSLAKLVHTIEQNDVRILSIVTEPPTADQESYALTMKLNVHDASRVRHLLEHYGYRVTGSHGEAEDEDDLRERVEAFMRYLDI